MMQCMALLATAIVFTLSCAAANSHAEVMFTGLGSHTSKFRATSLSADGQRVGGFIDGLAGLSAALWQSDSGVAELGILIGRPSNWYHPRLVLSADGTSVVGMTSDGGAFRWRMSSGLELMESEVPTGWSCAVGTSANGDHSLVQVAGGVPLTAFIWSSEAGAQTLPAPPTNWSLWGYGMSDAGDRALFANSISATGDSRVLVWSGATGFVDIGIQTFVRQDGNGMAISGDGLVVAASSRRQLAEQGPLLIWQESHGIIDGGLLAGDIWADAHAMSTDGSVIVGASQTFSSSRAFMWREDLGMVSVREYVASLGVDLSDWEFTRAMGVSSDGATIIGLGRHRVGGNWYEQSWMVTIPAPATGVGGLVAASMLATRRRRS